MLAVIAWAQKEIEEDMNANAFWNHLVAQEPCNIVEYKLLYLIDQFWYIKIHTWLRGLGEYCWLTNWLLLTNNAQSHALFASQISETRD